MYKFLLTKLDQDVYEVFAYFFENAEEYESISDLANKLSVSKRRIVLVIDRALDLRERYPFYDIEPFHFDLPQIFYFLSYILSC